MNLREFERKYFEWFPDYEDMLRTYASCETSATALYNGDVACCFGAVPVWKGVAEAWILTSYIVERNPISLTRGALRYFNKIAIDMQLHRLQIVVDDSNLLALRWAEVLKFKREGLLKGYGPDGSDHYMMARYF
jgi:hypothetical protein